jgi:hypothetical protein
MRFTLRQPEYFVATCDAGSVTLAELTEEPLVLLDLPLSRDYLQALFIAAGLRPVIGQRSPHLEVIRRLLHEDEIPVLRADPV